MDQHQYTSNAESCFPLVGHTDRQYFDVVQNNHWSPYYDSSLQPTGPVTVYHTAPSDNYTWQDNVNSTHTSAPPATDFPQTIIATHPGPFAPLADYPESSQRTVLTSSPDDIEAGVLQPIYDHRRSHTDYGHATYWDANTLNVDNSQYTIQDIHTEPTLEAMAQTESTRTPPLAPASESDSVAPPPYPSVKVEPDDPDGCFIMELSSMSSNLALSVTGMTQTLAPPTEVPLRATQASKEMRKMMGVFRLNPFAMHTGGEGRGVPALWCGGGPLEEEPLIFEFQLNTDTSGDRQLEFDHAGIPSGASRSPTDLLGAGEDTQLRSFSPSFELHPEDSDLRSDVGEERQREQEDCTDPDQQNEGSDPDCGKQSEVDTSSATHSVHTPSETRPAHTTPPNESSVDQYPTNPSVASTWDIASYQAHGEGHFRPTEKMERGHSRMHRVHIASHPYLRRSHQAPSSSSTHSLPQSHPQMHPHPQPNYAPLLQHSPTHHHHHHHYHQAPCHSPSYSQHPTVHDTVTMIPAPLPDLEQIPVSSHRPGTIYSSYTMRSGTTLKLADDHYNILHHHPADVVNDYTARGTASNEYTSQHDPNAGGYHYEHWPSTSSSSGHVLSPSRRWSWPETMGGSTT